MKSLTVISLLAFCLAFSLHAQTTPPTSATKPAEWVNKEAVMNAINGDKDEMLTVWTILSEENEAIEKIQNGSDPTATTQQRIAETATRFDKQAIAALSPEQIDMLKTKTNELSFYFIAQEEAKALAQKLHLSPAETEQAAETCETTLIESMPTLRVAAYSANPQ